MQAYGYDGLGILAIRGVPEFAEARAACLPYAYRFGNLPGAFPYTTPANAQPETGRYDSKHFCSVRCCTVSATFGV